MLHNCQKHEEYIKSHILVFDKNGKLKCRERADLEYKESFSYSNAAKYAKTMAAFANNAGGYIIFGVKDKPREIVGVNNAFKELPVEKMTEILNSRFSPEILWDIGIVDCEKGEVGYIYVEESLDKPVMAIKVDGTISSGDIFYRYKARTEKIKYPEMHRIIAEREKRIHDSIIKLVESIRAGNTPNIGIINYSNGRISTPYGVDVAIDKKLVVQVLKKAKFIKEGQLKEGGEPVLMVTGNIDLAEEVPVPDLEPNVSHPYLQKDLTAMLGIEGKYTPALIWYFHLKDEKKYHLEIQTSKKTEVHKYSEFAFKKLKNEISEHSNDSEWLVKIKERYTQNQKIKSKKNK